VGSAGPALRGQLGSGQHDTATVDKEVDSGSDTAQTTTATALTDSKWT